MTSYMIYFLNSSFILRNFGVLFLLFSSFNSKMSSFMSRFVTCTSKNWGTIFALKRLFTSMQTLMMFFQGNFRSEPLLTYITLKRFLSRMFLSMCRQISFLRKPFLFYLLELKLSWLRVLVVPVREFATTLP